MDTRTLALLEYPKVLDLVAAHAASESGADAVRALLPMARSQDLEHENASFIEFREYCRERSFRLSGFESLGGLFRFLARGSSYLDLDGLVTCRQVLDQARTVLEPFTDNDELSERYPLLTESARSFAWPVKTWSALARCLSQEGNLRDESSPELLSARQEIRRIHRSCTKKVKTYIQENNLTALMQDDFITISSDRYVLPLKVSFKNRLPGVIHDYSQTGETCYFEPMFLVERNNELQELKREEREAERKVLLFLTDLIREEEDLCRAAYDFLVRLDVLQAKMLFAEKVRGQPLEFNTHGRLDLKNIRHPLLAASKDGPTAVPLDIDFGEERGLVISGGNAGGKTVCLKTLGLAAAMGMAGLPVAADEGSTCPLWTRMFVFLGDEQSLEEHVSTFTAQISHLSAVWDGIDENSLVILDEFGAGTDPSQGAALAQAVIDEVLDRGASVAAATHFPALKAYALAREGIRAASVLFDSATNKPLFRLGFDQVGASQALDVARKHGLAEEVLRRAESYLLLDGSDTQALIERLNDLAVHREQELEELRKEKVKLEKKRARLAERFEEERETLIREMREQSRDILSQWKSGRISHKKALKEMASRREQLAKESSQDADMTRHEALDMAALSIGERLRYLPWAKEGVVEELDLRRERVRINLNGVGMWAELGDLALCPAGPAARQVVHVKSEDSRPVGMRVDLRGQRADVAVSELSRFLDSAVLRNVGEVEVVHGKGTGVLRKEVHRFLKSFPAVASYALANEERGGDGMTLVELK